MSEEKKMQGKRVLVTGSGTGIGKGIAEAFAEEGAAVAFHYSRSSAGAEAAVEEIRKAGGKAEAFQADFADVDQVISMGKKAIDFLGGIDILINNAGLTTNIPIEKATPEQWDKIFHINVRGMYFMSQTALKYMAEQKSGAIINITSVHAFRAIKDHTVYASTKAAIVGFTRTLAIEVAAKGIRVNAIAPGMVVVDNYYKNMPDFDVEKEVRDNIPIGIAATPKDMANICIFLASEAGRYIVGQTIVADGGQNACVPFGAGSQESLGFTWGKEYTPWL